MRPCLKNNRILSALIPFSFTTVFMAQFWRLQSPRSKCISSLVLGESSLGSQTCCAHRESKSQSLRCLHLGQVLSEKHISPPILE